MLARTLIICAALAAAAAPSIASAQRFFARQSLVVTKGSGASAPVGVASCGALVRGQWFVDWQQDTGRTASTLAEAQTVCDGLAVAGAGTCGWTGDAYYGDHTRYRVFWTKMVATRQYNEPGATEGFVWAVTCPLR